MAGLALTPLLFLRAESGPATSAAGPDESLYPAGRYLYQRNCLVCHGARGDGRGEMAEGMFPRPRPFTVGVFKYRSTPPGFLPTDDDLRRIVRDGIGGTSMPAFAALSDRELRAVTEYIKFFSPKWRKAGNYSKPVNVPAAPAWFDKPEVVGEMAARGRTTFLASCAACHGEKGDGHGPATPTLVDDWDQPSRPADLRQPALRSGSTRKDLFRVLLIGIGGTPMPGYAETLTDEQRWELVAFVESLRKSPD